MTKSGFICRSAASGEAVLTFFEILELEGHSLRNLYQRNTSGQRSNSMSEQDPEGSTLQQILLLHKVRVPSMLLLVFSTSVLYLMRARIRPEDRLARAGRELWFSGFLHLCYSVGVQDPEPGNKQGLARVFLQVSRVVNPVYALV